jgi:hypothetical protein
MEQWRETDFITREKKTEEKKKQLNTKNEKRDEI